MPGGPVNVPREAVIREGQSVRRPAKKAADALNERAKEAAEKAALAFNESAKKAAAAAELRRQSWQKRPPLPPPRNTGYSRKLEGRLVPANSANPIMGPVGNLGMPSSTSI
jgi:hypothetical protein